MKQYLKDGKAYGKQWKMELLQKVKVQDLDYKNGWRICISMVSEEKT